MNRIIQVGNIAKPRNIDNPQEGRVYLPDGISPSIRVGGHDSMDNIKVVPPPRKTLYYDVYNKRFCLKQWCGTLTTHPQDGHSGTFWIITR